MALFGDEIQKRISDMTRGEQGGRHDKGYRLLTPLADDTWKEFSYNSNMFSKELQYIQARHSIVMDASDQEFQVGWSLYGLPEVTSSSLKISLVLMSMHEDEVEDQGAFPIKTSDSERDDHHFICTTKENFQFASLEVSCCAPFDDIPRNTFHYNWEPLTRLTLSHDHHQLDDDDDDDKSPVLNEMGIVTFSYKPPSKKHTQLRFCHSITRAELELDLSHLDFSKSTAGEEDDLRQASTRRSMVYDQDDRYDDDQEGEEKEEYEDDGFVVHDNSEDDFSGQFSEHSVDEYDDEPCCLCKDGGDLMICEADGTQDSTLGCGKSFHAECVGRDCVPDGDWICGSCAKQNSDLAMLVKLTPVENPNYGYEFPSSSDTAASKPTLNNKDQQNVVELRGSSEDDDEKPKAKPTLNNKDHQELIFLDDSSDDDDENPKTSSKRSSNVTNVETKQNKKRRRVITIADDSD